MNSDGKISSATKQKLSSVFKQVLKEVKPSEEEISLTTEYSNELMHRLKTVLPKNVEIILAGSVARGTQVRGKADIDIFLLFPKDVPERQMETKAIAIAKKIVYKHKNERYEINYAEHPYLKIISTSKQMHADIVPAFKIEDVADMGTAVDRTQLHNKFVMSNLSKEQKDDVRLLKQFLNAHKIYGAESKISGFSGYLCELLIYHYGALLNLLVKMQEVRIPLVIDAKKRHEIEKKEHEVLVKKFKSRFIVIDPTDNNRNVAANVSEESLARLVFASRKIINDPNAKYFEPPKYSDLRSSDKLRVISTEYGIDIFVVKFSVPNISEDIIVPQIIKLEGNISRVMADQDMEPIITLHNNYKNSALIAIFVNKLVQNTTLAKGPSVFMEAGSAAFYKKHKHNNNILIHEQNLYSVEKSKYTTPKELLHSLLKDKGIYPSKISPKSAKIYMNKIPEEEAKLVYKAYMEKTYL